MKDNKLERFFNAIDFNKDYEEYFTNAKVMDVRLNKELNRMTLLINLDTEVPFFEYNLIFPILSKKNYEGQDFIYGSSNNAPIGTGKYKRTQNSSDSIILKKNENYKRAELTLEKIIYTPTYE